MNNDLISRSALKEAFKAWKNMDDYYHNTDCNDIPLSEAFDLIDNAPTVTPTFGLFKDMLCSDCEKRPQGDWITVSHNCWKCPYCQELTNEGKNFCPNCGAEMKGSTI